jgi:hypothetical protein
MRRGRRRANDVPRSLLPPLQRDCFRLSVVIPVYNECGTVRRAIEDVLAVDLPGASVDLVVVESNSSHIITLTPELLNKFAAIGKNLNEFSLETVQMFHRDATTAGYTL